MELGEKEARRPDAWARTLAIVVARCPVEAARAPLRAAGAYDPRRGGTLALEATREQHCAGTAEVLHRQLELVADLAPQRVLVIEVDAMRGIDYASFVDAHAAFGLGATLAYAEIAAEADGRRGTVIVDGRGHVLRLDAAVPTRAAAGRNRCVPAGAYVLDRELLVDSLEIDAAEPASTHDFRADVLPLLVRANGVAAHRVLGAQRPPAGGRTRQASRDAP